MLIVLCGLSLSNANHNFLAASLDNFGFEDEDPSARNLNAEKDLMPISIAANFCNLMGLWMPIEQGDVFGIENSG